MAARVTPAACLPQLRARSPRPTPLTRGSQEAARHAARHAHIERVVLAPQPAQAKLRGTAMQSRQGRQQMRARTRAFVLARTDGGRSARHACHGRSAGHASRRTCRPYHSPEAVMSTPMSLPISRVAVCVLRRARARARVCV
jgi:hypothetical protein